MMHFVLKLQGWDDSDQLIKVAPSSGDLKHQMWGRGWEAGSQSFVLSLTSTIYLFPFLFHQGYETAVPKRKQDKKNNKKSLDDRKIRIENKVNLVGKSSTSYRTKRSVHLVAGGALVCF